MKYIHKNGILLIEDIYNNDLSGDIAIEPNLWSTESIPKIIPKKSIESDCYKRLIRSKNIDDFSSIIRDSLMPPLHKDSNPTEKWFSEVVDLETTVGHKDIPLNKLFIDSLSSNYTTNYITINCPWLFQSIDDLKSYITQFWFLEHKDDENKLSEIFKKAKKINGIHPLDENNRIAFGWSLALITIQNKEQDIPSRFYASIFILLTCLISISIAGILLKLYTTNTFLLSSVSNILIFFIGITSKEFYEKLKSNI